MKTSFVLLAAALILSGCAREQVANQVSPEQLNAVKELQSNYQQAKAYNDSLVRELATGSDPVRVSDYDNRYHLYDAAFTTCHNGYDHTLASANHAHHSSGMVQMHGSGGGMMGSGECSCCTNGGHSADIHEQMDALRRLHALHHPR